LRLKMGIMLGMGCGNLTSAECRRETKVIATYCASRWANMFMSDTGRWSQYQINEIISKPYSSAERPSVLTGTSGTTSPYM
jgi:hypothetical protein